jgi:hypothetical protein
MDEGKQDSLGMTRLEVTSINPYFKESPEWGQLHLSYMAVFLV